jgi:hypothetical protein
MTNCHTIGPPGAPIANRPWGARACDNVGKCDGQYTIEPAGDVLLYDGFDFTHAEGVAAGDYTAYMEAITKEPTFVGESASLCSHCETPLIKQHIHRAGPREGLPLIAPVNASWFGPASGMKTIPAFVEPAMWVVAAVVLAPFGMYMLDVTRLAWCL